MSGFLLDTNVVSEPTKNDPDPQVLDFLTRTQDVWLSVIVILELERGVHQTPHGRRRYRLRSWLTELVAGFEDRIASIDRSAAEFAAVFQARTHEQGGQLKLDDALIAGTAMARNMTVVTRNVKDFDGLGVDILNPWDAD